VNSLLVANECFDFVFNPEITLKALSYFADGDLRALPEDMKERLVVAAREVDLEHLPDINHAFTRRTRDHGFEP